MAPAVVRAQNRETVYARLPQMRELPLYEVAVPEKVEWGFGGRRYVTPSTDKRVPLARIAVRLPVHEYPVGTSYKTYLDSPASGSPEAAVAHYLEWQMDATQDYHLAARFFADGENAAWVTEQVEGLHASLHPNTDHMLLRRYDVGSLSFLAVQQLEHVGVGLKSNWGYVVRRTWRGYRLTAFGTASQKPAATITAVLDQLDYYFERADPKWSQAKLPDYAYAFSLPSGLPNDRNRDKNATIRFNGIVQNLPVATDPAKINGTENVNEFVNKLSATAQSQDDREWGRYWTNGSVLPDLNWVLVRKDYADLFRRPGLRSQLIIDCNPAVLVFLRDNDSTVAGWHVLPLWRNSSETHDLGLILGDAKGRFGYPMTTSLCGLFTSEEFRGAVGRLVGNGRTQAEH